MEVPERAARDTQVPGPWDRRSNHFDALRLGLALLVIYSHAYPLATGSEGGEPLARLTRGQVTGGAVAVDAFFIMSGFLIAASAERSSSVLSFLAKRARRIYPGFVAAALLSLLVLLPLSGGHLEAASTASRAGDLLLQTLRLREFSYRGAFPQNPYPGALNGSVWSIPYEFWCYLGVAGLLTSGILMRRRWVACLFAVAWALSVAFRVRGWILGGKALGLLLGPPHIWARLLPLYLAGVVFYLFRNEIPRSNGIAAGCVLAMGGACLFPFGWTLLSPIAGTYLLFFLAYSPARWVPRAGRFGDFSYGTYLYAFPVEQLLMARIGHPTSPLLLFLLAAPPTLLLAVCSWYLVERMFLSPVRRHETVATPEVASTSAVSAQRAFP